MSRIILLLSVAIGLISTVCYADFLVEPPKGVGPKASALKFPFREIVDPITGDIEEDKENDPFITNRKGKLRPNYVTDDLDTDSWLVSDVAPETKPLSRKKRCPRGDDDDDGDANRARRTRRGRGVNRSRNVKKAISKQKTTTVTRKVIQNGQVISQTTETLGEQPAQQMTQAVQQPVIIQHHQQPAATVVQQAQPVAQIQPVVQAPSQTIVQAAPQQPTVQTQTPSQPAAVHVQPVQQTQSAIPSISVQGSVKIN